MNTTSFKILEYDLIKDRVKELCVSNLGKTLCDDLTPCSDIQRVRIALQETTEARLMANGAAQPIQALHDISEPVDLVGKGLILAPKDLLRIADTMRGAAKCAALPPSDGVGLGHACDATRRVVSLAIGVEYETHLRQALIRYPEHR